MIRLIRRLLALLGVLAVPGADSPSQPGGPPGDPFAGKPAPIRPRPTTLRGAVAVLEPDEEETDHDVRAVTTTSTVGP
jgi:hypothetical protein